MAIATDRHGIRLYQEGEDKRRDVYQEGEDKRRDVCA